MGTLNQTLLYGINGGAGTYHWLDVFFIAITQYGIDIIALVLTYYLFYTVPRRTTDGVERLRAYTRGLEIVFSTFVTWFVVNTIKVLVQVPRPFMVLPRVHPLIIETDYSFPSGHAAVSMVIATAVYFYYPRLGKILFIFACLMAFSRVYVGVHYPFDVIAGALIGIAIPVLIHKAFSQIGKNRLQ